jgi:aprataxin
MSRDRATADDLEEHNATNSKSPSNDESLAVKSTNACRPQKLTELPAAHELTNDGAPVEELMKPNKIKTSAANTDLPTLRTTIHGRAGLGPYTVDPASFPDTRVLYFNDKFTVIRDLYPKASVHLLILPRDRKKNLLQPQKAFDDRDFLEDCRNEEVKVRKIVADELRRRFGHYSVTEQSRVRAMEAADLPAELPTGRDWSKEVISGIHANPSMSHLHIHVLSRDMVSEPMKKRNHYLSFTTDFLVGLEHFPLARNDYRRNYGHFPADMHCWRCGKNFENKMSKLKVHLDEEWAQWVRE